MGDLFIEGGRGCFIGEVLPEAVAAMHGTGAGGDEQGSAVVLMEQTGSLAGTTVADGIGIKVWGGVELFL